MEEERQKKQLDAEVEALTESPVFGRMREWWRAKKESLDLWGFEKYLGVNNAKFKKALNSYKSLLLEIDHEFDSIAKSSDSTTADIEQAKERREEALLDAKRDFVYQMPEHYRLWFKKRRVFNSWRITPESWGFEEARYWGSRSGLSMKERRVLYGGAFVGLVAIGLLVYFSAISEKASTEDTDKGFGLTERGEDLDSLIEAKRQKRLKAKREKEYVEYITEHRNKIIDDINSGVYTTTQKDMWTEIKSLLKIYYDSRHEAYDEKKDLNEEIASMTLLTVGLRNPKAIAKQDAYGIPREWKVNEKVQLTWGDITSGMDEYSEKMLRMRRRGDN